MAKLPDDITKLLTDVIKESEKEKEKKEKKKKEKRAALTKRVAHKLRMIYYGPKYHAAVTKSKKKKPKETATSLLVGYARKSGYRK